jgi:hypothetical protein
LRERGPIDDQIDNASDHGRIGLAVCSHCHQPGFFQRHHAFFVAEHIHDQFLANRRKILRQGRQRRQPVGQLAIAVCALGPDRHQRQRLIEWREPHDVLPARQCDKIKCRAVAPVHQHLKALAGMHQQLLQLNWIFEQPPSEAMTKSERPSDAVTV